MTNSCLFLFFWSITINVQINKSIHRNLCVLSSNSVSLITSECRMSRAPFTYTQSIRKMISSVQSVPCKLHDIAWFIIDEKDYSKDYPITGTDALSTKWSHSTDDNEKPRLTWTIDRCISALYGIQSYHSILDHLTVTLQSKLWPITNNVLSTGAELFTASICRRYTHHLSSCQ